MDPPGGFGEGSSAKDDSDSQTPAAADEVTSTGKGKEPVDEGWCAVSSSSLSSSTVRNVPGSDLDALWPDAGRPELDEMGVPWCDDDQHDHERTTYFERNIGPGSSSTPKFPLEPNMCTMRGKDLEAACSTDRFQLVRQESLQEILAEPWVQLVPDEIEKLFSQDDFRLFQEGLEPFLIDDPAVPLEQHNPETPTDSETLSSPVSICDTEAECRDSDPAAVSSTGESLGGSGTQQPAGLLKRKERVLSLDGAAARDPSDGGAPGSALEPQQQLQQQQSIDGQKKLKRPEWAVLPGSTRSRYAIQTRTEVDVINDGYRWRKYGQKPVKNSAHPRNYYRCTTANCPVRKQVERSTENPTHVLTTYDGIHNHPKNSTHHSRESTNPPTTTTIVSGNIVDQVESPLPTVVVPTTSLVTSFQQQQVPLGPLRLPPSNYIAPDIISHLLAVGSDVPLDQRRWSSHLPQGSTFFSKKCQSPQGTSIFQSSSSQVHQNANLGVVGVALEQAQQQNNLPPLGTTSRGMTSTSRGLNVGSSIDLVSSQQQRLLWMQDLMGENLLSEGPSTQQFVLENLEVRKEDLENIPDNIGDPPA